MQSNIHAGFTTGYLENSVPMFPQTAVPAAILALQSQAATVVVVEVVVVVVVNFESVDFFALAAGIDLAAVHLSVVDCFPEVNEIVVIVHDAYLI